MKLEWDDAKAASNLRKHGIGFDSARRFEFDTAIVEIDAHVAYGEERLRAYGFVGTRLHVMVYVERGDAIRVISLRRATQNEKRAYENYVDQGW